MDSFFGLFFAMSCNTMFFDNWSADFDVIGALPLEVAIIILRKLDGKSLLNAAQVSFKWFQIIKSDKVLRKTVRDELARQRQEKLKRHLGCYGVDMPLNGASTRTAFHPEPKKRRRTFEKSIRTTEKKSKRTCTPSVPTTNLKRMR